MPQLAEKVTGICYVNQIPEVVRFIKDQFAKVSGVLKVAINIRVCDRLVVYVFIEEEAARTCDSDMIFPKEVGIRYLDDKTNRQKHPRLWLEERAAEVRCEGSVADSHPNLKIEWVTFLRDSNGRNIPVG